MAVTQNPATIVKIGFASKTITGYCPTGVTITYGADIEHIICNGEFKTSLVKNKSHTLQFQGVVLDAGSLTAPVAGDAVTIDSIVYLCTTCTFELSDGASRINFQGIKHADAAYA